VKLKAKELRTSEPTKADLAKIKRRDIYIICDNVLDTYNIGSIFRLADAVAAKKVFLCAGSESPPNPRIAKASVGTDKWVPWEYFPTAREAIENIRGQISGIRIIAIEQSTKATDFREADYSLPIALVVGHETDGVSKEALAMADQIVEIPMFGVNISLNVMVSLAIVLFRAI
jgi:tRNA G18 (ribose-2'-O)-methylase SpoU